MKSFPKSNGFLELYILSYPKRSTDLSATYSI